MTTATLSLKQSQQLQLQQPQQRLPNEILCYIVDQWCFQDFRTLHSLLFVNRLFFHAAAPHLWSDPFEKWDLNYRYNKIGFIPDREKLMAIMFASFLEARLLEQEQQEQEQGQRQDDSVCDARKIATRESDAQRVDDILKPFGLRIAKGVQSPFLRHYLKDKHRDLSSSVQDIDNQGEQSKAVQDDTTWKTQMTINYSKYFGSLSVVEWRFLDFDQLIQLRSVPPESRFMFIPSISNSNGNDIDGNENEKDEEDEEQEYVDSQEHKYELTAAIASLMLCYNFENITDMTLEMELAPKCLVLAPKMAKLRELYLQRSEAMPDSHLESTILFIRRNMEAFPRKPPLDLTLGIGWYSYEQNFDGFLPPTTDGSEIGTLANETAAMDRVSRERRLQSRIMKSKIALWEAVGSPQHMTASMVPLFYECAKNIQLDRLQGLSDEDMDRLDYGEGPGMQAFLRKCSRLQELTLNIGDKDVLSWAAEEALIAANQSTNILSELLSESDPGHDARLSYPDRGEPSWLPVSNPPRASGILPNLESLDLDSERPYRFLIHALNDAMVAFANSLRTIRVHASPELQIPNDWQPESILARRRARLSLPLYHVPWANTIGGGSDFLPFSLPHLKVLSIRLNQIASVQIGSFAQCPNLEEISMRFGDVVISEMHPDDRVLLKPSSPIPVVPENLGDMRYQQARIDRSLFPVWNLPRLRSLMLNDLAAMRFDFESLQSMQCLELLEIRVSEKTAAWCSTKEYLERQTNAWKNKHDAFLNSDGSHGDDSTRIRPGDETGVSRERNRFELQKWSLPKLKTLLLSGPPASMFFLEWLRECPELERISLTTREPNQRIGRFFQGTLPRMSPSPLPPLSVLGSSQEKGSDENHGDSDCNRGSLHYGAFNERPLLYSRLESLCLKGAWVMSDEDLLSLLTIYAPFLADFDVERLGGRLSLSGYRFLKTLFEADQVNQANVKSMLAPSQSQCLQGDSGAHHDGDTDDKTKLISPLTDTAFSTQPTSNPGALMGGVENALGEEERSRISTLGARLRAVYGRKMTLTKRNQETLGLKMIKNSEAYGHHSKLSRTYYLMNQCLVTREDYYRVIKKTEQSGENNRNEPC